MGVLVEIKCSVQARATGPGEDARCASAQGGGVGAVVHGPRRGILDKLAGLEVSATLVGWKTIGNGKWICPYCLSQIEGPPRRHEMPMLARTEVLR